MSNTPDATQFGIEIWIEYVIFLNQNAALGNNILYQCW